MNSSSEGEIPLLIHIVKCPEFSLLKNKPKTDLSDNEISVFLSFAKKWHDD